MSKTKFSKTLVLVGLAIAAFSSAASGAELDYPELMVTPRASERVQIEAGDEPSNNWTQLVPIQLSAAATLAAGLTHDEKTEHATRPQGDSPARAIGIAVGGAWLVSSAALAAFYQPYAATLRDVRGMPAKTPREQLIRERLAEEAIEDAARLGRMLSWLSTATNLGASIYMLSNAEDGSNGIAVATASAVASLAPLVFRTRWQKVASDQRAYKKKIYGPITDASATPALFAEPGTGSLTPGLALSFAF